MQRRRLLQIGTFGFTSLWNASGFPQTAPYSTFDAQISSLDADPDTIALTHQFREYDYREISPSDDFFHAQPLLSPLYRSNLPISTRAKSLLIRFEVSSAAVYEQRYTHPTWPKGQSGITIGVGYDIGYVTQQQLTSDWGSYLNSTVISALAPCCKKKARACESLLPFVSDAVVPWQAASAQFESFLPNVAGQVTHVFPNCDQLSPDSFGALVSLVYNRGSGLGHPIPTGPDTRWEMRAIRDLMGARQFARIPTQISAMKRLWMTQPNARGLLIRRDLEASLFQAGLT